MRPLKIVSLSMLLGFSLAACNSIDTVGEWEGECELTTEGYAYDLEFEFDIEDEKGGRISGEGAYLYQGYIFDGELSGSRNGTDVEITLEGEYGGYTVKLELEGELDDDDIEGTCRFGGGRGMFEMER